MPSILKNKPPVEIVLACDKGDKEPATFLCKRLTMGESHMLANILDNLSKCGDADEMFGKVDDCLNDVVTGWRNMGDHVFGESKLSEVLTFNEVLELLSEVLRLGQLPDTEKNS